MVISHKSCCENKPMIEQLLWCEEKREEKEGRILVRKKANAFFVSKSQFLFISSILSLILKVKELAMARIFIILASINLFLSVALGAFGAHGLQGKISAHLLDVYKTGVHYHMIHGLGLFGIGLLGERAIAGMKQLRLAGWFLQAGIVFFSFSLYALALTGIGWLGAITPIGGVCFLIGWILLAVAAAKK
jgi:uncharacterized membrane protein YgdD (TMEM256/DUF423 family)